MEDDESIEDEQSPYRFPPATGQLPVFGNLPGPNIGDTEWVLIENRSECTVHIPPIPGKRGGGYYSECTEFAESEPHYFIYQADLSDTEHIEGETIEITRGIEFEVLEYNMVMVIWDPSKY
jgi:hypothetical protein